MQIQLAKLSDVPTALDLLKEEVAKAEKAIRRAGADAMLHGPLDAANEAIAYAKKLVVFASEIDSLGSTWASFEEEIDSALPETKTILKKVGWTRNVVNPISPWTNFTVTFPDGTVVSEPKANATLAKTIEKIGPEKVAPLHGFACLRPNGEPLVTQNRSELTKYPVSVIEIHGGWFVNTQSSTAYKADAVKAISKILGLHLKVSITARSKGGTPKPPIRPAPKPLPSPSPAPVVATPHFPYPVGKVVQAVFPILQTDSRMTKAAVDALPKPKFSARFKTGGNPVLKPRTGKSGETTDAYGRHRYYHKLPLTFHGKPYWLTSQFKPHGIGPVLDWLAALGLDRAEVLSICKKRWEKPVSAQPDPPELPL